MSGEKYALFVATLANIALHVLRKKSEFWTNFSSLEPLIWPQPFISSSKLLYSTSQTTSFFFKSISTQTLQTLSPPSLLRILQTQEQDSSGQCLCPPDTPAPAPPSWGTRSEARAALQLSPTLQPCHLVLLSASSAPFPLHRYPMLHSLFWQPNYFIHSTLPSSTAIADIELQPPPSSDPPPTYVPPPPSDPPPPCDPPSQPADASLLPSLLWHPAPWSWSLLMWKQQRMLWRHSIPAEELYGDFILHSALVEVCPSCCSNCWGDLWDKCMS